MLYALSFVVDVLVLYAATLCTLAWKNGFAESQSLSI